MLSDGQTPPPSDGLHCTAAWHGLERIRRRIGNREARAIFRAAIREKDKEMGGSGKMQAAQMISSQSRGCDGSSDRRIAAGKRENEGFHQKVEKGHKIIFIFLDTLTSIVALLLVGSLCSTERSKHKPHTIAKHVQQPRPARNRASPAAAA